MSLRRGTITVITLATAATVALGSWALFVRQTPEEAEEAYMTECASHYEALHDAYPNVRQTPEGIQSKCSSAYWHYLNGGCWTDSKFDPCNTYSPDFEDLLGGSD